MNCVICKQGETRPGNTTVTLTRGETTLVVKNVPAEEAVKHNAEVEVIQFAA